MDTYSGFASVYDEFMDSVPYEEWCEYIVKLLNQYGCGGGLLLELGCGTGTVTELLARKGYDMIGVDGSGDMLAEAIQKREKSGLDILYLQQDMREFELYGTVAGAVCVFDSINYMLKEEELVSVFRLVNNYLDPGGIFLFDFTTAHAYREAASQAVAVDNREDRYFLWEDVFDEETQINEHEITVFLEGEDGRYGRLEETHYQRAYTLEQMKAALLKAGMEFVAAYEAFTEEVPGPFTDRIYVAARERGKSGQGRMEE